jgi:hypothetical protein
LSARCPQTIEERITAELNRVAASATSAQVPWRGIRIRSGRTTPNPAVAALIGTNASSHGRATSFAGQVRTETAIVRSRRYSGAT